MIPAGFMEFDKGADDAREQRDHFLRIGRRFLLQLLKAAASEPGTLQAQDLNARGFQCMHVLESFDGIRVQTRFHEARQARWAAGYFSFEKEGRTLARPA